MEKPNLIIRQEDTRMQQISSWRSQQGVNMSQFTDALCLQHRQRTHHWHYNGLTSGNRVMRTISHPFKTVKTVMMMMMMMMMTIVDLYSALRRAPLLHCMSRCIMKMNLFSADRKDPMLSVGSRRWSGSRFQTSSKTDWLTSSSWWLLHHDP